MRLNKLISNALDNDLATVRVTLRGDFEVNNDMPRPRVVLFGDVGPYGAVIARHGNEFNCLFRISDLLLWAGHNPAELGRKIQGIQ